MNNYNNELLLMCQILVSTVLVNCNDESIKYCGPGLKSFVSCMKYDVDLKSFSRKKLIKIFNNLLKELNKWIHMLETDNSRRIVRYLTTAKRGRDKLELLHSY